MIKNILNWTAGGFFRALGRVLCFLVIGLIIGYLLSVNDFKLPDVLGLGIMKVKAEEISYTGTYRLQFYNLGTGEANLTTVGPFNTGQTLSNGYGVSKVITRYYGTTFSAGSTYRVQTIVGFAPSEIASSFRAVDSIGCFGTTSSSNWNADSSLIASCNIIGISQIPNTNRIKYIVDLTPASNVAGIQFNINYVLTEEVRTVNVYTASTITTGPDIAGSIDEQTAIMQEEFENLSNTIEQSNQNLINSITEQNKVCAVFDRTNIIEDNKTLVFNNGTIIDSNGFGVTNYYKLSSNDQLIPLKRFDGGQYSSLCFYNINKQYISCLRQDQLTVNQEITIPQDTSYVRFTINKQNNEPIYKICKNGNQATNDLLSDTDTSDSTNEINDWFHNFNLGIEGPLSSIVLLPINLLETLIVDYNDENVHSSICATLKGQEFCLPSGDLIWNRSECSSTSWFGCPDFESFKDFFQLLAGGLIIYSLLKRIVKTIDISLDPTDSDVKVVDL